MKSETSSTVSRRSALLNTLHAQRTQNACQPFKTARRSAEAALAAGNSASPEREVKPPSILLSALTLKDAIRLNNLQPSQQKMFRIPLTASRKSVRLNMLLAKRTPSAFPLSKIVRKSAEAAKPVGSSASLEREVRPLLTQPSAQPLMDVLVLQSLRSI